MKCVACNKELDAGVAKCSLCGFPVIQSVQSSDEDLKQMKKLGQDFLKNKLSGISVGIITYDYTLENRKINLDGEAETVIANADSLAYDSIVWCDKAFEPIEVKTRTVVFKLFVNNNQEKRIFSVKLNTENIDKIADVGVTLDDELTVRFLVGEKSKYISTDKIQLI